MLGRRASLIAESIGPPFPSKWNPAATSSRESGKLVAEIRAVKAGRQHVLPRGRGVPDLNFLRLYHCGHHRGQRRTRSRNAKPVIVRRTAVRNRRRIHAGGRRIHKSRAASPKRSPASARAARYRSYGAAMSNNHNSRRFLRGSSLLAGKLELIRKRQTFDQLFEK